MASEITQTIEKIILERKATANNPKLTKDKLESLKSQISQLKSLQPTIKALPNIKTGLVEQLDQINFPGLIAALEQEQQVWETLRKRFNRDTINIGVVGLARQGKSTFLQNVAGLTDDEIPSSDRLPCTSVQSNVYHSEGEAYGLVHFHSEQSFLQDVIKPYYEELGFSNPPESLEQFRNTELPPAPINPKNPAKAGAVYNHLRNEYYLHLAQYADLLDSEKRQKPITKQEIKEYVSQDYDSLGNPRFFSPLAVEKVEIFCPFPKMGVKKIALVDMPGLGDTRLGDEERMIKALGRDVDFILFIRRPDKDGDFWGDKDTDLYDAAFQALKDKLPLQEWSFMLLNYDGENERQCKDLESTRIKKNINVKQCLINNCKKPKETNQVLGQVLDYLAENMVRLDKQYMSASLSSLESLQLQVNQDLERAKVVMEDYGDSHGDYVTLRDKFLQDFYQKIEDFREELRNTSDHPNTDFQNRINATLEQCKQNTGIPKLETIKIWTKKDGINAAYFQSVQQMRPHFLKHFHPIENGLKEFLDMTKLAVAEILIELGLGGLTEEKGTAFLESLADEISTDLKSLKLGFQFISSFEISYKGFIQSRVWGQISEILPADPKRGFNILEHNTSEKNLSQISDNLAERHQEVVESCQEALNDLALLINKLQLSMVEEFADHITRAEGVKQEWDMFLGKYRHQIWSELQVLQENLQLQQQWLTLVNESLSISQALSIH
ncbi:MAG: hypothetical protein WA919_12205 [Coleofasciculaceae cyanobacterium]